MKDLHWLYHRSHQPELALYAFVVLLRLSTIDTNWTQRVVGLLLRPPEAVVDDDNDSNSNTNSNSDINNNSNRKSN